MELSKQVCSLELAQKLKELGVNKPSYCAWKIWNDGTSNLLVDIPYVDPEDKRLFSAFTVAELGELLPINVCYRWTSRSNGHVLHFGDERFIADTEADARAKMLVYLLENK